MFPNMDPKAIKAAMSKLGIKSTEIEGEQVVIRCKDKDIVIDQPQITMIEGQGMRSFQIVGEISEVDRSAVEISDDDIKFVREQTGVSDADLIRKTLEETKGDMAEAIVRLKGR